MIWSTVGLAGLVAYHAYHLPDLSGLAGQERAGSTSLIAADGTLFASFGPLHGEAIAVEELRRDLTNALIATEDRRFRDHWGVDPISIARAIYVNLRDGRVRQGGSTLTQQLAKNLFLAPDRSFSRKFRELLLSFWLESRFSKDEILTIYLNRVYFGAGAYGIDAAARKYFGKSARALTLYESAAMVALLKAPSHYNPVGNPEKSHKRVVQVLANMVDVGLLGPGHAKRAAKASAKPSGAASLSRGHRYFGDWVIGQLAGYVGPSSGDRKVVTTLRPDLQALAEAAVARGLKRAAKQKAEQAALVVMDKQGAVLAMVGGADYRKSQFNRATQALRQPGSVFKPLVYLAALVNGYTEASSIEDKPWRQKDSWPRNFDGRYHGPVSLSTALTRSLNAASVRLAETVGRDRIEALTRRLGITTELADDPSLALGSSAVSLIELTAAYAAFANGGQAVLAHGIDKVDIASRTHYRRQGSGLPGKVPAGAVAALNRMLARVVTEGTGKAARINRPMAGKTGTSQANRDAWFIGYTADYVVGVWVGRDGNKPMKKVTGGGLPARIWADFMKKASKGLPVRGIPGVVQP
jgi:penicillin-binding protein 1A